MQPSDIDTGPPPAVKNLRSRFEQLALAPTPNGPGLTPSFPRPRATSGSHSNGDRPASPSLRPSNSSSDLRLNRKPPPPPSARGAKPSPTASPLLRPAPSTPPTPNGSLGHRSNLSSSSLVLSPAANVEETQSVPSVSSLRNLFANAPIQSPHTPRPSISGLPFVHSESDVTGIKRRPPPPPVAHVLIDSSDDFYSPDALSESDEADSETSSSVPPSLPPRQRTFPHHQRTSSSQTSSESDLAASRVPPPRPPPRQKVDSHPAPILALIPPPLPVRRNTVPPTEELLPGPPPLPVRPVIAIPLEDLDIPAPVSAPAPSTAERKMFGSGRLPPPPTRTIALGEKLPPARRPPSPSSDEESADEAPAPDLPDSSRSSRRPPLLSFRTGYVGPSEPKVTVPAHHGHVIVSGTSIVVATHHHVKIYDVSQSDVPVFSLEKREVAHGYGVKDLRVTSMEYRPCGNPADRGCLLWIGTKDGHLVELDVRTGCVTAAKLAAHLHPIVRIFRHGRSMVTLDDAGKTLLFAPGEDGADIELAFTPPRVARITEKQDFAKLVNGKLWTATRAELHGARMQTIRVFDLFVPGAPARAVAPIEAVGAITDATMLPTNPGIVYVGHEAGSVSLWSIDEEGGWPRCIEVVRVSTSDVLCLEGVNNRLWAGSRGGVISAYDVSVKPWVVTNAWMAHTKLPVNQLAVDHYGIEKTGRLCVVSVGRDEQVRMWDGLLASDWVDLELMKREASFSTFRDLSVLIITWNADSARPDSLTGDAANINFLHDALTSVDCPDIITFGFQEVVDLESRKMVAKNVLLGRKDKQDASVALITGLSGLSEKVTTAYRKWYEYLVMAVRLAMPAQVPYTVIHTESLVGLFTCVFVKNTERMAIKDNVITSLKRGMGGRYGNKGGIITRLVIEDSSICFINCHLAAGQHATRARNADIAAMLEERSLLPESENEPLAYVGGGDGQMALDHEIVFINGDMNYRIDQRRDNIISTVRSNEFETLLAHDQLLKEIKYNRGCRLRGFMEGPLTFPPTYKYDRHSTEYDSSEKARAPAWCDRVLWRTRLPNRVQQLHYQRYEVNVSDHRPVSAAFKLTVKSIRHEVRQKAKAEVQLQWAKEQERLLSVARDFYVDLALI
ncbi:Endonuclease/exonuclease/phosphatase [Mycena metata]|uniref:Endonuclease/exonuclease/phosphatase n=1 Tax=Mycena metata TaxID=1033252 RepID=A0AAD7IDH4_9AGAR|nr:Endonuclease/exonuclease/phosphatase [Mycena metata]